MRTPAMAAAVVALIATSVAIHSVPSDGTERLGSPRATEQPVGLLAYAGVVDGRRAEIFTIRTDGSQRRQLTANGGTGPDWSPDGTQIAYSWNNTIRLVNADGSGQRALTAGATPAWAPDGNRLAYQCDRGLCIYDLVSGTSSAIFDVTEEWPGASSPSWSPDGTTIAFTRHSSRGDDYTNYRQLYTVHPDGTGLSEVPNTFPEGDNATWSATDNRLIYTERYDGRGGEDSGDIYSIEPDGSNREAMTLRYGTQDTATWSPEGAWFAARSESETWHSLYLYQDGIWLFSSDATSPTFVVRDGSDPDWHPSFQDAAPPAPPPPVQGPLLAYVAASGDGYDLYVVRPDGSGNRQLTRSGRVHHPTWSPSHRAIAYVDENYNGTTAGVRMIDIQTGQDRRVAAAVPDGLTWSPNGRRLAWGEFPSTIMILDVVTHERTRLRTPGTCCPLEPAWSPNGRLVAYSTGNSPFDSFTGIEAIPVRGGAPRAVTELPGEEFAPDWQPDGRTLTFTHQTGRWYPTADLLSIHPRGTGTRATVAWSGIDHAAAWSPEGKWFAFFSDGRHPFRATPQAGIWIREPGKQLHLILRDRSVTAIEW